MTVPSALATSKSSISVAAPGKQNVNLLHLLMVVKYISKADCGRQLGDLMPEACVRKQVLQSLIDRTKCFQCNRDWEIPTGYHAHEKYEHKCKYIFWVKNFLASFRGTSGFQLRLI